MSSDLTQLTTKSVGGLSVMEVGEVPVTFNMLVYGDAGVGKTVLAGSSAQVPDMSPVLFIDMEGGTLSIREKFPSVDVVRVKDMDEMQRVYEALRRGDTDYRTVVVDSLTELQKFSMGRIMHHMVQEDPDRDPDVPSLREWGKNLEQTRRFVRAFRDLPMNTLFTALSNTDKDQKTGKVTTRPGLTGKAASEIAGFLDIVVYMYMKEADGELSRLLLSQRTDRVIAKDRSGRLPQIIEEPTMGEVYKYAFIRNDQITEENEES